MLLVVSGALFVATLFFPVVRWDPYLGMAFWPRLILGLLMVVSVFLIVKGSVDGKKRERISPVAVMICVACVVFAFSLETVGYLISAPVFILILGMYIDKSFSVRSGLIFLSTGIAASLVIFILFYYGLQMVLPLGLLEFLE